VRHDDRPGVAPLGTPYFAGLGVVVKRPRIFRTESVLIPDGVGPARNPAPGSPAFNLDFARLAPSAPAT
jgi:hypothetical protein